MSKSMEDELDKALGLGKYETQESRIKREKLLEKEEKEREEYAEKERKERAKIYHFDINDAEKERKERAKIYHFDINDDEPINKINQPEPPRQKEPEVESKKIYTEKTKPTKIKKIERRVKPDEDFLRIFGDQLTEDEKAYIRGDIERYNIYEETSRTRKYDIYNIPPEGIRQYPSGGEFERLIQISQFFARFPAEEYVDYERQVMRSMPVVNIEGRGYSKEEISEVDIFIPKKYQNDPRFSSNDGRSQLYVNNDKLLVIWVLKGTDLFSMSDMYRNYKISTSDMSNWVDSTAYDLLVSIIRKYKYDGSKWQIFFASHSQGASIQLALLDTDWNDPDITLKSYSENMLLSTKDDKIMDFTKYVDKAYFYNTGYPPWTYFISRTDTKTKDKKDRLDSIINFFNIKGDIIASNVDSYKYGQHYIFTNDLGLFDLSHSSLNFLSDADLGLQSRKEKKIQLEQDLSMYEKDSYKQQKIRDLRERLPDTGEISKSEFDISYVELVVSYTEKSGRINWRAVQDIAIESLEGRLKIFGEHVLKTIAEYEKNIIKIPINNIEDIMPPKQRQDIPRTIKEGAPIQDILKEKRGGTKIEEGPPYTEPIGPPVPPRLRREEGREEMKYSQKKATRGPTTNPNVTIESMISQQVSGVPIPLARSRVKRESKLKEFSVGADGIPKFTYEEKPGEPGAFKRLSKKRVDTHKGNKLEAPTLPEVSKKAPAKKSTPITKLKEKKAPVKKLNKSVKIPKL
jgi:hypothetical protein